MCWKINHVNHHINRNKITMMSNENQWQLMKEYHAGRWFGFTSKHEMIDLLSDNNDIENNDILNARLIGTTLQLNKDKTTVTHLNAIPKDYLCMKDIKTVKSLKKDDIIEHNIATYDNQNLTSKFCHNCALGGPSQTPNGDIYIQFSFRYLTYRYRVLLRYEAIEYKTIKGTSLKVPSLGGLTDISISREKLQSGDDIDLLSSSNQESSVLYDVTNEFNFDKISSCTRYNMNDNPIQLNDNDFKDILLTLQEDINTLKDNEDSKNKDDNEVNSENDNDEDNENILTKYAGNCIVQCPSIISDDDDSMIELSWIIQDKVVYRATVCFEAYRDTKTKPTKGVILQPLIKNFWIDEFLF